MEGISLPVGYPNGYPTILFRKEPVIINYITGYTVERRGEYERRGERRPFKLKILRGSTPPKVQGRSTGPVGDLLLRTTSNECGRSGDPEGIRWEGSIHPNVYIRVYRSARSPTTSHPPAPSHGGRAARARPAFHPCLISPPACGGSPTCRRRASRRAAPPRFPAAPIRREARPRSARHGNPVQRTHPPVPRSARIKPNPPTLPNGGSLRSPPA